MILPEIYILRHGETEWNAQNRMQGGLNSSLTAKGRAQAARQHDILRGCDLTGFRFVCSPQGRAFQTAGIACATLAGEIETDTRLREIGVGDWAGRLRDELPVPAGENPLLAQYEHAPGGEGFAALEVRCRAFLADLDGPAVLVTHGITSRMLRLIICGQDAISTPALHGGQGHVYHLRDGVQNLLS